MIEPLSTSATETRERAEHGGELVYRHRLPTRLWHWTNAVAIIVLLMSGLMISNAHPHLYWGEYGANFDQPWWSPPRFPGWATIPQHTIWRLLATGICSSLGFSRLACLLIWSSVWSTGTSSVT